MLKILTVVSLLLSAQAAYSVSIDACSPMRLDNGGSLDMVPVMNQLTEDEKVDSELCYAFSAAQMIDAYRFSHGDTNYNHITSPFAVAIDYKRDKPIPNNIAIGSQAGAINATRAFGSCSTNSFLQTYNYGDAQSKIKAMQETGNPFLYSSVDESCQERLPLNFLPKATGLKHLQPTPVQREVEITIFLNKLLNKKNPQPIGITFCPKVLEDKRARGIMHGVTPGIFYCHNGLHASIVIGRRISKEGKCQFLVRNSVGTDCRKSAWDCEYGQTWIDAEALTQNILQTHYIGEQQEENLQ